MSEAPEQTQGARGQTARPLFSTDRFSRAALV